MRKWTIVSLTLLISMMLVACNSKSKVSTTTLQAEQNGVLMELTYKAEGDKVIEQAARSVVPYESLGVSSAEEAEEYLAEFVVAYENVKAIQHHMDYKKDEVIETLSINYKLANPNQVKQLSGSTYEGDGDGSVSLQKSIAMLEGQGFEIVK